MYNLEETDVMQFWTHMTKLDLCIMYCMTTNNTYKDIHVQLLAHNMDLTKPKIPGLKSNNLDSLTFENMGWCFLQLATRKLYHALLTYNKKHTEDQSNLSYMIQYTSLESKFNGCWKKKPSSMPRQFTIVIALTTAPICHNLHNRNLYVEDYGSKGIPDASRDGIHACFVEWAMHNLGFIIIPNCPHWSHSNAATQQAGTQIGPIGSHANKHPGSPMAGPQHAAPVQSLSPIRPVELDVLPLPAPHYAGLIWPDSLDTMALMGPSIEALTDAILTLCLFVAKNSWDAPNERFHKFIDNWQGPEFSTPDIMCDNWHLPATLGQMKVIIEPSGSHRAGINKIVFREALLKAMRDTDLYSALPNNSPYFTAKFPMAGMMTSQRIQWRAQGLLLAICTVMFHMPLLPISPFLFLTLVLETPQIPHVLDALTGPVVRALDPICEAFMEPWLGCRLNELLTTKPAKN
ncbi:hypothetical protein F5146DRAFT_1004092 [Armillaria mellea]|nr:hypothetical protein F5146DRAFT_1004092 [Armillaria mellea]